MMPPPYPRSRVHRQIAQILSRPHPAELYVPPNPVAVTTLGSDPIMPQSHHLPTWSINFNLGLGTTASKPVPSYYYHSICARLTAIWPDHILWLCYPN